MTTERFLRTELLIGSRGMELLEASNVVVAGLGAVGSYAVEGLARSGVGGIRLIDIDTVKRSNINRQLYALESTLGRSKAEAAAERVLDINPGCRVSPLKIFVHHDTMDTVLEGPVDFVIDAIDSLNPKIELLASAYERGIPVVSSMGAALRTDFSLVKTGDIFDTYSCPLAKMVRKRLRNRGVGRGIKCVFSTEKVSFSYTDPGDESFDEGPEYVRGRIRRTLGSLSTIPGIYGLVLANMVVNGIIREKIPSSG